MPAIRADLDYYAHQVPKTVRNAPNRMLRLDKRIKAQTRAIELGLVVLVEYNTEKWRTIPGWRKGPWLVVDEPLC